jgi:ABC-type cobalamin transport system ATPase subunit
MYMRPSSIVSGPGKLLGRRQVGTMLTFSWSSKWVVCLIAGGHQEDTAAATTSRHHPPHHPSSRLRPVTSSGLDARAALIVMRIIKRLARAGLTAICTIHQPSLALFNHFDSLLLLRRGGQL